MRRGEQLVSIGMQTVEKLVHQKWQIGIHLLQRKQNLSCISVGVPLGKYFFEDELLLWINIIPVVLCRGHSMGSFNVSKRSRSFFS